MTTVVCVQHNRDTVMASDSAGTNSTRQWIQDKPKVIKVGDFVIGYAGSYREANIIEYEFEPLDKEDGETDEKYLYRNVNAIKDLFENRKTNDKDHRCNSSLLIYYKDKVYEFDTDFQFMHWSSQIYAIGSGSGYALGAMKVLDSNENLSAYDIALEAVKTAAHYDPSTSLPVHMVTVAINGVIQ
jgi:ATP-dependent protease HslVU (ClpYQ) peptidase subunit